MREKRKRKIWQGDKANRITAVMCHLIVPRHTRFAIGRSPDCAVTTCLDTHALPTGAATLYMSTGKPLKNISLPTMQTKEKVVEARCIQDNHTHSSDDLSPMHCCMI